MEAQNPLLQFKKRKPPKPKSRPPSNLKSTPPTSPERQAYPQIIRPHEPNSMHSSPNKNKDYNQMQTKGEIRDYVDKEAKAAKKKTYEENQRLKNELATLGHEYKKLYNQFRQKEHKVEEKSPVVIAPQNLGIDGSLSKLKPMTKSEQDMLDKYMQSIADLSTKLAKEQVLHEQSVSEFQKKEESFTTDIKSKDEYIKKLETQTTDLIMIKESLQSKLSTLQEKYAQSQDENEKLEALLEKNQLLFDKHKRNVSNTNQEHDLKMKRKQRVLDNLKMLVTKHILSNATYMQDKLEQSHPAFRSSDEDTFSNLLSHTQQQLIQEVQDDDHALVEQITDYVNYHHDTEDKCVEYQKTIEKKEQEVKIISVDREKQLLSAMGKMEAQTALITSLNKQLRQVKDMLHEKSLTLRHSPLTTSKGSTRQSTPSPQHFSSYRSPNNRYVSSYLK